MQNSAQRGVIYVLFNPYYNGIVKIGQTSRDVNIRVKELSQPTGVPGKFEAMYDALVSDVVAAERDIHREFAEQWEGKEFFRVKVRDAIRAIQRIQEKYPVDLTLESEEIDILPLLEKRMRRWLKREIVSVKFVQLSDLCLLKIVSQPSVASSDAIETLFDLRVLAGEGDCEATGEPEEEMFCCLCRNVRENANLFVSELDVYSMLMVDIDIINNEAGDYITDLKEKCRIVPPMSPPEWQVSRRKHYRWGTQEDGEEILK